MVGHFSTAQDRRTTTTPNSKLSPVRLRQSNQKPNPAPHAPVLALLLAPQPRPPGPATDTSNGTPPPSPLSQDFPSCPPCRLFAHHPLALAPVSSGSGRGRRRWKTRRPSDLARPRSEERRIQPRHGLRAAEEKSNGEKNKEEHDRSEHAAVHTVVSKCQSVLRFCDENRGVFYLARHAAVHQPSAPGHAYK